MQCADILLPTYCFFLYISLIYFLDLACIDDRKFVFFVSLFLF